MPAGARRVAPDDLAGDDPIERQIPQLEDLAHAARAEPFDGLKPLELRQRVCRWAGDGRRRCGQSAVEPAVERHGDRLIALDELMRAAR